MTHRRPIADDLRAKLRGWEPYETAQRNRGRVLRRLRSFLEPAVAEAVHQARKFVADAMKDAVGEVVELGDRLLASGFDGGWLVVWLSGEGETCVFRLADAKSVYVVSLSDADLRSCHLLAVSFWGNGRFLPSINSEGRLIKDTQTPGIPPGLDYVAQQAASRKMKTGRSAAATLRVPGWAVQANSAIRGAREYALRLTYKTAVETFLAHELGHIWHGHVPDGGISHSLIMPSRRAPSTPFPYRGAELVADRWAISALFALARKRGMDAANDVNTARAMLLGAMIPFLNVRGHEEFSSCAVPRQGRHPPVWLRCYELIRAYGTQSEAMARFRNQLIGLVSAVAERHAIFGTWLEPLLHDEPAEHARKLLQDDLAALEAWELQASPQKVNFATLLGTGY